MLLNSNYELLNSTTAKTDAEDYYNWLKTGLENFNKNKTNTFNVGSIDFQ